MQITLYVGWVDQSSAILHAWGGIGSCETEELCAGRMGKVVVVMNCMNISVICSSRTCGLSSCGMRDELGVQIHRSPRLPFCLSDIPIHHSLAELKYEEIARYENWQSSRSMWSGMELLKTVPASIHGELERCGVGLDCVRWRGGCMDWKCGDGDGDDVYQYLYRPSAKCEA